MIQFFMKPLFSVFTLITLICSIYSCKKNETKSSCGSQFHYDLQSGGGFGTSRNLTDTTDGIFSSYLELGKRVFRWSQTRDDICSADSVQVSLTVGGGFLDPIPAEIETRGKVEWGNNNSQLITMSSNPAVQNQIIGVTTLSLSSVYGNNKGSYTPIIEIYFDRKGTYNDDENYLLSNIFAVTISGTYSLPK